MQFQVYCASRKETRSEELPQAPGGEVCPVCGKVNDRRFPADQQCDFRIYPITKAVAHRPEAEMPMAL